MILVFSGAVFYLYPIFYLSASHSSVSPLLLLPLCLTSFKVGIKHCSTLLVVLRTKRDNDNHGHCLTRTPAQLWGFEKQSPSLSSWFGRWKYSHITELSYKFKHKMPRYTLPLGKLLALILLFDTIGKWPFLELKTLYHMKSFLLKSI